jgi:AraC-like DNA-binding protein
MVDGRAAKFAPVVAQCSPMTPIASVAPDEQLRLSQAELAVIIARHACQDGLQSTSIDALRLIRATSPSQPLPALYEAALCIVVQGRKHAFLGGETYVYDPLKYLVISVTLPITGQIVEASERQAYLCMSIGIDTRVIGELLLQLGPGNHREARQGRGLYVARTHVGLADAALRLARLLDHPRDAQVLAPLILREIHYRVLEGELGSRLREICVTDSQSQRVASAIQVLRSRYAEPLTIEELASGARMSPSSLHHRFKAMTTMSPLQFQKQLRLHEARRLMLTQGFEAATAAHRVGYQSPTQFSREYRRLFGAPPRREIETIRQGTAEQDSSRPFPQ